MVCPRRRLLPGADGYNSLVMTDEIRKTIKDAGDAVKEGVHRGKAGVEHERRTETGDVMTGGEKAGSMAREVTENAKADVDKAKRETRDAL